MAEARPGIGYCSDYGGTPRRSAADAGERSKEGVGRGAKARNTGAAAGLGVV